VRTFLSPRFLLPTLAPLVIALIVGMLVWLYERRQNNHFGGPSRAWADVWHLVVGCGYDSGGRGAGSAILAPGRLLAVVWMIVSIITLAVFTGGITSAITMHLCINSRVWFAVWTIYAPSRRYGPDAELLPTCEWHLIGGLPRPAAHRSSRLLGPHDGSQCGSSREN
jgi:hypothetical protein